MWWEILEVNSDASSKEIKRAYARLIKIYRPDSHPDEFRQIRQAFEVAKQALNGRTYQDVNTVSDVQFESPEVNDEPLPRPAIPSTETVVTEVEASSKITQTQTQTETESEFTTEQDREQEWVAWYDDFVKSAVKWQEHGFNYDSHFNLLMSHPALDYYESHDRIKHEMFEFLIDNVAVADKFFATAININHEALFQLNEIFQWQQDIETLMDVYDEEKVELIFYAIEGGKPKIKSPKTVKNRVTGFFGLIGKLIKYYLIGKFLIFMFMGLYLLLTDISPPAATVIILSVCFFLSQVYSSTIKKLWYRFQRKK